MHATTCTLRGRAAFIRYVPRLRDHEAADISFSPTTMLRSFCFLVSLFITMANSISADVLLVIFDHLPLSSLIRLRCTCRYIDSLFSQYLGGRFRTRLETYFRQPQHFLQEMTTTSSIIMGSTALAMLTRATWEPADLDICTPHAYFAHMVSYLISVEDYTPVLDLPHPHPLGATRFGCTSAVRLRRAGLLVDVVQSAGKSAVEGLRSVWHTGLLCYATASSFTIAYPSTAECQRAILRPIHLVAHRYPSGSLLEHLKTYRRRGCDIRIAADSWDRELDLGAECAGIGTESCALTVRSLGDRFSVTGGWWNVGTVRPRAPLRLQEHDVTLAWWEGGVHFGTQCRGHGNFTTASTTMILKAALQEDVHDLPTVSTAAPSCPKPPSSTHQHSQPTPSTPA